MPLEIISIIVSGGVVLVGHLHVMNRGLQTIERLQAENERWRSQAFRDALAAQQMRERLAAQAPTTLMPAVNPHRPAPQVTVTRQPAPVPPIAASTGEQPTVPTSGPIGTRTRRSRAAADEATT
jgi:hypothetical protein